MAVEKDVKAIDEAAKKPAPKVPEPEHFADCVKCHGTGLDEEVLCANCAGSGKALPSQG